MKKGRERFQASLKIHLHPGLTVLLKEILALGAGKQKLFSSLPARSAGTTYNRATGLDVAGVPGLLPSGTN